MITFITAFRKFLVPYNTIQRSALYSWKQNGVNVLAPKNEVDSNNHGYDNVKIIEGIKTGRDLGFKTSAVLLNDLLRKTIDIYDTQLVMLINPDIILPPDFVTTVRKLITKYGFNVFLTGARRDIQLTDPISNPETYQRALSLSYKIIDRATSSDYFITSRVNWRKIANAMPDLIHGRMAWDNWLHMYPVVNNIPHYDCTDILPNYHCIHDDRYVRLSEGKPVKETESTKHNLALWEKTREIYDTARINDWPKAGL